MTPLNGILIFVLLIIMIIAITIASLMISSLIVHRDKELLNRKFLITVLMNLITLICLQLLLRLSIHNDLFTTLIMTAMTVMFQWFCTYMFTRPYIK